MPIASQTLHAVGVAKAFQYRKQARVAVTTIGDGGTSEGDFYEAMNVAGAWQLPVVFIINNNQWAISIARDKQTHCQTLAEKAFAAGLPGIQVDGNDVVAMHQVCKEAIERARTGGGATVVEAITYRLSDHTTADDAKRYRPETELEEAWHRDPLPRMKQFMITQGLWSEAEDDACKAACEQEVQEAAETYLAMPPQAATSMFDSLYHTLPESYQWQRAMLAEEDN